MRFFFFIILFAGCTYTSCQVNNDLGFSLGDLLQKNNGLLEDRLQKIRLVALGDGTHSESNVIKINIEIVKYLHEELGFNTIAFESGIYDLFKANKIIKDDGDVSEAISNSIFPIWSNSCEFQELIKYIHEKRGEINIVGFDNQFSGNYSTYESIEDLRLLLQNNEINNSINFEFLQGVFIRLGEEFSFNGEKDYKLFEIELGKVKHCLQSLRNTNTSEADFWLQYIKSTENLVNDYFENDPNSVLVADWKAKMSNPRDAQMADNLLFYMSENPREKVICWGASAHFANDFSTTNNDELRQYKPMAYYLKQKFGSQVYSIAPIIGSGTFGVFEPTDTIPDNLDKSIEFELSKKESYYQFVDLRSRDANPLFTSSAIEYTPIQAEWNKIFDGFIYIKKSSSTSLVNEDCFFRAKPKDMSIESTMDKKNNSIIEQNLKLVKGRILSDKQKEVPFCNISVKNSTIGTISNENGNYQLIIPISTEMDTVVFSCVGFETREVSLKDLSELVILESRDFVLDEVMVQAKTLNPKSIVEKAIVNIPSNYIQEDYNAEIYSRGILTNHDSVKIDVENVVKIYDENGYDNKGNITSRRIAFKNNECKFRMQTTSVAAALKPLYLERIDMVSTSPLLKKANLNKYNFKLIGTSEYEGVKVYKIAFESKLNSYRYSGYYYIDKFEGLIYINSKDYSIIKINAYWEYNVDKINKVGEFISDKEFINLRVAYKKNLNNYFLNYGNYLRYQKGVDKKNDIFYELEGKQTIYISLIELDNIDVIPTKQYIPSNSKKLIKDTLFWKNYNKPIINE